MKTVKSIINKLFNNKSYESSIINLGDVIQIPKRNDIDDQQLLLNIDKYKKEYLDILNTKGYLLPNMLSSKEIQDEMKINIDLIVKLYLEYTETTNDKISLITKYLRLKLYLDKVTELGNVVLARLIALKEIFNEKIIISKHKRQRISYEINNLLSILVTFNSQRSALEKESDIYHDKILTFDNGLNLNKDETNFINKKLKEIIELINFTNPDIKTEGFSDLSDLVALERELEIYVYRHKDEIDKIKADYNSFKTQDLPYADCFVAKLLKSLKEYELLFRIFNEYGRNLITDEEMEEIYRTKFKILTNKFRFYDYDFKLITDKTSEKELESYKTIVSEMIEDIVKGKTFNIEAYNSADFFTKRIAINCMIKILKNGKDTFDVEEILKSNILLNLLLVFTNQEYLSRFFRNYKLNYPFHNAYITWDKYLPLETIFIINNIINQLDGVKLFVVRKKNGLPEENAVEESDLMIALKELYNIVEHDSRYDLLTAKNEYEANVILSFGRDFYLPEGIKSISMVPFRLTNDHKFFMSLLKNAANSRVVFPKSLESVNGNIFSGPFFNETKIREIKLNDGLKELDMRVFLNQISDWIYIPSSVSKIDYSAICAMNGKNVSVYFIDFKESKILNNHGELTNLLKELMYIPHQREINLWMSNLVLNDSNFRSIYTIDLEAIKDKVMKKWETMEYWAPSRVIEYAVLLFKETVHIKTGYMLGGYDNMPLDNIDEELLPEHLKVKKLTM